MNVHQLKDNRGSFTIEATMAFPVIILLSVGLLFFGLYMYEKAALQLQASQAAQRIAAVWTNSYANPVTGSVPVSSHDDLYWRTFQDGLPEWFPFLGGEVTAEVNAASVSSSTQGGGSLPQLKLQRAGVFLPPDVTADLQYSRGTWQRSIKVTLNRPLRVPQLFNHWWGLAEVRASGTASAADPVEFVRNVDFTRSYLPVIVQHFKSYPSVFGQASAGSAPQAGSFDKESEARVYLQQTVGGTETTLTTPSGKKRLVDALDQDGTAHQAFLGYQANRTSATENGERMNDQLQKDVELLQSGQVKAVVWHFYKSGRTGKAGPSGPLRAELERNGIIVMVHD
ncbi:TadE/TadG family type IV pilus assembly protein [Paenibacillus sp. y28]|uniref:TadE/TadG family type IV pilus assembly protein n=1 Tax=Paenibacillus sp. y28 TaxID=3129110 RepID=UPI00301654C3